jgi:hypothetical protein
VETSCIIHCCCVVHLLRSDAKKREKKRESCEERARVLHSISRMDRRSAAFGVSPNVMEIAQC